MTPYWVRVATELVVDSIKVAVTAVPSMLREVLRQVLGAATDIELVDAPPDRPTAKSPQQPDVVVLAAQKGSDQECWNRLLDCPTSSIIAVDLQGQRSSIFQLRRHKESLGEASAEGLLDAIRSIARRGNETQ